MFLRLCSGITKQLLLLLIIYSHNSEKDFTNKSETLIFNVYYITIKCVVDLEYAYVDMFCFKHIYWFLNKYNLYLGSFDIASLKYWSEFVYEDNMLSIVL